MSVPLAPIDESLINFLNIGAQRVRAPETNTTLPPVFKETKFKILNTILSTAKPTETITYYQTLGYETTEQNNLIHIQHNGNTIITFLKLKEETHDPETSRGIFHIGIRYSSAAELSQALTRLLYEHPETYRGIVDNTVSTSAYFTDPSGHNIKLYIDNPQEQWQWNNEQIKYTAYKIDIAQYINKHFHNTIEPNSTITTELIHLQVSNIKPFEKLLETIGLTKTLSLPSLRFYGTDTNHHAIAINTWNSTSFQKTSTTTRIRLGINNTTYEKLLLKLSETAQENKNTGKQQLTVLDASISSLRLIEQSIEIDIINLDFNGHITAE